MLFGPKTFKIFLVACFIEWDQSGHFTPLFSIIVFQQDLRVEFSLPCFYFSCNTVLEDLQMSFIPSNAGSVGRSFTTSRINDQIIL